MSTHYYVAFFKKSKEDNQWCLACPAVYIGNGFYINNGWDFSGEISYVVDKELIKAKNLSIGYTSTELLGKLKDSPVDNKITVNGKEVRLISWHYDSEIMPPVLKDSEIYMAPSSSELKKELKEFCHENYIAENKVAIYGTSFKTCLRGQWFTSDAFDSLIKEIWRSLLEDLEKDRKAKETLSSLDYLKLDEEGRQNVRDALSDNYCPEDIKLIKSGEGLFIGSSEETPYNIGRLQTFYGLKYMMETLADGQPLYAYLYNSNSFEDYDGLGED